MAETVEWSFNPCRRRWGESVLGYDLREVDLTVVCMGCVLSVCVGGSSLGPSLSVIGVN